MRVCLMRSKEQNSFLPVLKDKTRLQRVLCTKLLTPLFEVYKTYLKIGITKFKLLKVSHIELKSSRGIYEIHKK